MNISALYLSAVNPSDFKQEEKTAGKPVIVFHIRINTKENSLLAFPEFSDFLEEIGLTCSLNYGTLPANWSLYCGVSRVRLPK